MAGWRQAVALAMTGEEIEALTALSRSRTEPAGRVSRAAMLLGFREKPSFFAVGRRLGVQHQTVQRCVERAIGRGALAALLMTDRDRAKSRRSRRRPRPGWYLWPATRPRSTAIRMNCGRHGFWPLPCARERGPAAGHQCLARLAQGTVCKLLGQEEIEPHKVRYYLERRDAEFEPKMAEVLCVYREVQVLKKPLPRRRNRRSRSRSSLTTRSLESRPSPRRHRICRQCQAAMRASRGIMSTNAMARSACWPGSICSPARSTRSSGSATAAASSSNSSSFSMPPIRPAPRSS